MTRERPGLHRSVWRWHFYAGLFVAPVLLVLALTGAIYLFSTEINDAIYPGLQFSGSEAPSLPVSRLLEVVNALVWWAPLADPVDRYSEMRDFDAARRARIFVDAYGLDEAARRRLVSVAIGTARRSWRLMQHRRGVRRRMWDEGVGETITRRQVWLEHSAAAITRALTEP